MRIDEEDEANIIWLLGDFIDTSKDTYGLVMVDRGPNRSWVAITK